MADHACMCVRMCLCMYACVLYVFMCVCMHVYICMYMCMCVCKCVCVYICVTLFTHVRMHVCIYVCMCVGAMCACVPLMWARQCVWMHLCMYGFQAFKLSDLQTLSVFRFSSLHKYLAPQTFIRSSSAHNFSVPYLSTSEFQGFHPGPQFHRDQDSAELLCCRGF